MWRAADACFVSQPTLSVAVRKLEDELGVRLFERGSHEVSITPSGEQIVAQAQRVLDEAGRITEIAGATRDQLQGPLRVGFIYTIGPYLLPSLVPELRQRAPHMPLLIEEGYTADLRRRIGHRPDNSERTETGLQSRQFGSRGNRQDGRIRANRASNCR